MTRDREWVLSRSKEGFEKNYSIDFPHDESLLSRGKRLSPLHQVRVNVVYLLSPSYSDKTL